MKVKKPRCVVISISIPDDLLERIDRHIAALYPQNSRSKYIERVIKSELDNYDQLKIQRELMLDEIAKEN